MSNGDFGKMTLGDENFTLSKLDEQNKGYFGKKLNKKWEFLEKSCLLGVVVVGNVVCNGLKSVATK